MENIVQGADRLGNTIRLGVHYAMMINSRDDITQIIQNIGNQKEIKKIRIYNRSGKISYSTRAGETDHVTNVKEQPCYVCHKTDPPALKATLAERTRIFESPEGEHLLRIISPIYNQPGCASAACHFHPEKTKVLGALDVVVSLTDTDREIFSYERGIILMAVFVFLGTSGFLALFLLRFVNRPIRKLIEGTRYIGRGEYNYTVDLKRNDDIGLLAEAINQMGKKIGEKQEELNKQKGEYQKLFELAPCYITVQDRDFKLLRYNREFAEQFDPHSGDYCYQVYKGRSERCEVCPVLNTFEDGQSHHSEEEGGQQGRHPVLLDGSNLPRKEQGWRGGGRHGNVPGCDGHEAPGIGSEEIGGKIQDYLHHHTEPGFCSGPIALEHPGLQRQCHRGLRVPQERDFHDLLSQLFRRGRKGTIRISNEVVQSTGPGEALRKRWKRHLRKHPDFIHRVPGGKGFFWLPSATSPSACWRNNN